MVQLEIFSPDGKSESIVLEKFPTTIGRSRINDIVLTHRTVSRKHAIILKKNNTYVIKDVGSQNGTFLRKRKINEAILQNEDVIYIGAYTLKFIIREDVIDLEETLGGTGNEEKIKLNLTYILEVPDRVHGVIFPEATNEEKQIPEIDLSLSREDTSLLAFPDEFLIPREEFPMLYDLQRKTMEDDKIENTLENIANYLLSRTDGDRVVIFLNNGSGGLDLARVITRPGVELDARKLSSFPSLLKRSIQEGKAILANGIDEKNSEQASQMEKEEFSSYSAIFVPLKYDEKTAGVIQIETYQGKERLDRNQLSLVCRVTRELAQMIIWKISRIEEWHRKLLQQELNRIYPEEIVEFLFQKDSKSREEFFNVKEQVASVITCQILNFRDIYDCVSPTETQKLLQSFTTTVRKSILDYKGSIIDMSNERVVGLFGLPIKQLDAGVRAVLAALRATARLDRHLIIKKFEKRPIFGIGIQSGLVTGGDISLNGFHSLFALGNPVNVSLELASLGEEKSEILIAPEVFFDVRFYFDIEEVGLKEINATSENIMVYKVMGLKESVSEESILYLASENADSEVTSEEFLKFPDV